ncbi:hypothetical protein [Glycomyces algeriensis]|uniref:Uncharacterized protein n=1 Tax=Glycomyces algeriensis TaxID=256037 RepID=A0A9W6G5M6_9ACTN|nr:hypothetical protein [Glycomyces algeriensis]MDA1368165.1 hypothetical protein [Glycomyces algeriensis]MDR7348852.1 hypothetical protein [Glycomyces algeriensis]GLI41555.1 hypothetical protein GALLR39Z86_14050 [Glycomyces algeriensis]
MIEPRQRDTTADSPDWVRLDEFYIGIGGGDRLRLTVFRSTTDPELHRLVSDEMTSAGPRLIAVFTEPPGDREEWHPAWRTDQMRPTVERQARALACA